MNKKEQEEKILKKFLELCDIPFCSNKLSRKGIEPSDIEYDNQEYQITTGDGEYLGKILANTSGNDILCVPERITPRSLKFNEIANTFLTPILEQKSKKSDKSVILIISILTTDPFTDKDRIKKYQGIADRNQDLIGCWKKVYCIYKDKQLIILS